MKPTLLSRLVAILLTAGLVVAGGPLPVTGNPIDPSGHGPRVTDPVFSSQALAPVLAAIPSIEMPPPLETLQTAAVLEGLSDRLPAGPAPTERALPLAAHHGSTDGKFIELERRLRTKLGAVSQSGYLDGLEANFEGVESRTFPIAMLWGETGVLIRRVGNVLCIKRDAFDKLGLRLENSGEDKTVLFAMENVVDLGTPTKSTHAMIHAMERIRERIRRAPAFIDVGAHTGILGCLAGRLGAPSVIFVERMESAIGLIRANAETNHISPRVYLDITDVPSDQWDNSVVAVNISDGFGLNVVKDILSRGRPAALLICGTSDAREEALSTIRRPGWRYSTVQIPAVPDGAGDAVFLTIAATPEENHAPAAGETSPADAVLHPEGTGGRVGPAPDPEGDGTLISLLGDMWAHWLGLETPTQMTRYVAQTGHQIISLPEFRRSGAPRAKYADWLVAALRAYHADPTALALAPILAEDFRIVPSLGTAAPGSHWHQLVYVDPEGRIVFHEEFLRWLEARTRSNEQAVAYLEQVIGDSCVRSTAGSNGRRLSPEEALRSYPATETLENALIGDFGGILPEIPVGQELASDPLTQWLNVFAKTLGHRFRVASLDGLAWLLRVNRRKRMDLIALESLGSYGVKWAVLDYLLTRFPESNGPEIAEFLLRSLSRGEAGDFWNDWREEHHNLPPLPTSLSPVEQALFFRLVAGLLALDGDLEALHRWVDPHARRILGTLWPNSPPAVEEAGNGCQFFQELQPLVKGFWPEGVEPPSMRAETHRLRLLLRDPLTNRVLGDAQRGDALLDLMIGRRLVVLRRQWGETEVPKFEQMINKNMLADALLSRFAAAGRTPDPIGRKNLSQLFEATISAIYAAPHATRGEALRQAEIWVVRSFQTYLRAHPASDPRMQHVINEWAAAKARESAVLEAVRVEVPKGIPIMNRHVPGRTVNQVMNILEDVLGGDERFRDEESDLRRALEILSTFNPARLLMVDNGLRDLALGLALEGRALTAIHWDGIAVDALRGRFNALKLAAGKELGKLTLINAPFWIIQNEPWYRDRRKNSFDLILLLSLTSQMPDQQLINAFELLVPGGILFILDRQEFPDRPTAAERALSLLPRLVQRPDLPYIDTWFDRAWRRQTGRASVSLAFQKLPAAAQAARLADKRPARSS